MAAVELKALWETVVDQQKIRGQNTLLLSYVCILVQRNGDFVSEAAKQYSLIFSYYVLSEAKDDNLTQVNEIWLVEILCPFW